MEYSELLRRLSETNGVVNISKELNETAPITLSLDITYAFAGEGTI